MNDMQRLKLEWLKREIKITRLKIEAWFIKTPVYRFFDIYVATFFWTIYLICKFRSDTEGMEKYIAKKKKEAIDRLEYEKMRNRHLENQLDMIKRRNEKNNTKRV